MAWAPVRPFAGPRACSRLQAAARAAWVVRWGFRSNRGTGDAIFVARRLIEHAWATHDGSLLLFFFSRTFFPQLVPNPGPCAGLVGHMRLLTLRVPRPGLLQEQQSSVPFFGLRQGLSTVLPQVLWSKRCKDLGSQRIFVVWFKRFISIGGFNCGLTDRCQRLGAKNMAFPKAVRSCLFCFPF